ncbi:MAG: FAD-dependent oxidoreductase [Lentisphaeria bacterium]|nr:MAG: FAD-dependent oxidoreductase [Lentisphaeria bacterium]
MTAGENYFSLWALECVRGKIEMNIGAVYGNGVATGKFSDAALAESGWSRQRLAEQKQTGIDGRQVSEYLQKTRGYLRGYYRHCYRQEEATRESLYPVALPIMPQYRKICAIQAAETMRDGQANRHVPDSVGLVADWRRAGSVWEVPFRSLYSASGPGNLLFAGRCMGAVGDAWEVMRVIPAAAVTGQAAGMAAALALRDRLPAPGIVRRTIGRRVEAPGDSAAFGRTGIDGTMSERTMRNQYPPLHSLRPMPFWAWNGELTLERLRLQIRQMKEMGFGGFFMHSRFGLKTEYLGERWFACVKECIAGGRAAGAESVSVRRGSLAVRLRGWKTDGSASGIRAMRNRL